VEETGGAKGSAWRDRVGVRFAGGEGKGRNNEREGAAGGGLGEPRPGRVEWLRGLCKNKGRSALSRI